MSRVYNFSAGPAAMPQAVLEQARAELLDWHGHGMSVMEMSHRGEAFTQIAAQAQADLRTLLALPDHYKVLFLQGGATAQFAMLPMNLARAGAYADYVVTGVWSEKALAEAQRYCDARVAVNSKDSRFTTIPPQSEWVVHEDAAYLHYTPNETIHGVEFHWIPDAGEVPLVADMSSTLLSRPLEVSRFGVIYAGAQKNIGPAGLTVVIVREDLLGQAMPATPTVFNYTVQAENGSMYNTPPTFAWYMAGLVFRWLLAQGGLEAMGAVNRRKAEKLYRAIDASDFYHNPVDPACRSWMNVPFVLAEPALDAQFLSEAREAGLVGLKGHRSVGGMRASLYNAVPETGVDALVAFMQDFEKRRA